MPNQYEFIYAACQRLAAEKPTFRTEDIVIAAWRLAPDVFGLRGHQQQHPDSKFATN